MFVGHYAAAFAVKAAQPRIPLWVLFLAVQLVDVGWALLVLADVEEARVVPGIMAASDLDLRYMPYTHGLLAQVPWAVAALLAYRFGRDASWRAAAWVAAAVLSHWALDWLVHAPDLPLWDDAAKVGLGLWDHLAVSLALELGLLAAGVWLFFRAARPSPSFQRGVLAFAALLVALQAWHTFGPSPPAGPADRVVAMALASYLAFAAVAAWVERRAAREA